MQQSKSLQARILSGSVVLLSGSGLATAINLAYNVAVARFLGPISYGHASVVYTLLTLISAITLSFQIVAAKFVAQQPSEEGKAAIYRYFHRGAWVCGIVVGFGLLLFQGAIANYLNLPSSTMVALLAAGAAFYVPLGVRRGYIQGAYGFKTFASNLVIEGAVRLGGSLLMILLGTGVKGVIAANSAAVAAAYLAAIPKLTPRTKSALSFKRALQETLQGIVFFAGQVLINNCDIVLVKHFFEPKTAGLYAAVAMVGRVIYSFSSAVVNSMFPIVAGTREEDRKNPRVIVTALLMVVGIGGVMALGLRLAPAVVWTTFFGAGFRITGPYGLPYLLALYAITTVIYSLSVVIITYEMSYKIANTSWVQLAFSGIVIAGICRFHGSLRQVIMVQLVLMLVLLALVAIPFFLDSVRSSRRMMARASLRPLRVLRRVSEDEVIASFLKSDFENPVFREYWEQLGPMVDNPNLADERENATRRALLYLRHLSLWKELPRQTEWYEIELTEGDLKQVRAFPRAQWRKLAQGNYTMPEIAERVRNGEEIERPFLSKIHALRERLAKDDRNIGSVVLIGLNEKEPLTILDGNHRLLAAMMDSPSSLHRLRFLCGLSPKMSNCCWYETNFRTLARYGANMVSQLRRDPEGELARLLQSTS